MLEIWGPHHRNLDIWGRQQDWEILMESTWMTLDVYKQQQRDKINVTNGKRFMGFP
jgi:hypothetical protein